MSLIHRQEMTEKNLAAKRSNGSMTRGPLTPEGKANSAAANLRHGFHSKAQNGALTALGEDPQEYAELMNSLENNLAEGLESELVQRIGRALWRMKRAERMQDGLAMKRMLIPMKVVSDSDLIPVTSSEVKLIVFGAKRRWRSYGA